MCTNDLEWTGEEDSAHRKLMGIGELKVPVQARGVEGVPLQWSKKELFQEGKSNIS